MHTSYSPSVNPKLASIGGGETRPETFNESSEYAHVRKGQIMKNRKSETHKKQTLTENGKLHWGKYIARRGNPSDRTHRDNDDQTQTCQSFGQDAPLPPGVLVSTVRVAFAAVARRTAALLLSCLCHFQKTFAVSSTRPNHLPTFCTAWRHLSKLVSNYFECPSWRSIQSFS